jgi:hypothetical protein
MKLEVKDIPAKLRPFLQFLKKYFSFIMAILALAVFGFLVFRINQLSRIEPDETAVLEKLETVRRPKIDQSVVDKIEQLQDQNIQVQSLFDQARNNPFSE